MVEDTVQNGLVLFAPEQGIPLPIQVELYNSAGNLVNAHPWPYLRSGFPKFNSFPFPLDSDFN
jgi:hypothetical protein